MQYEIQGMILDELFNHSQRLYVIEKDGEYELHTTDTCYHIISHEQFISLTHLLDNVKNESQKLKR